MGESEGDWASELDLQSWSVFCRLQVLSIFQCYWEEVQVVVNLSSCLQGHCGTKCSYPAYMTLHPVGDKDQDISSYSCGHTHWRGQAVLERDLNVLNTGLYKPGKGSASTKAQINGGLSVGCTHYFFDGVIWGDLKKDLCLVGYRQWE